MKNNKPIIQTTLTENPNPITEKIEGLIESIIFQSGNNSFTVLRLKSSSSKEIMTVVGNFPAPLLGEQITATGKWVEHIRFGRQFKADSYQKIIPTTIEAIERFLASGAIKGIGAATAALLVNKFGTTTLDVIEHNYNRLTEVSGIGKKKAGIIHSSYLEKTGLNALMLFLENYAITGAYAGRIYECYGTESIEIIKEDPYKISEEIKGVGFGIADKIALALGFAKNHPSRIAAAVKYALLRITQSGHCCVPKDMLAQKTAEFILINVSEAAKTISASINENKLCAENYCDLTLVYPEHLYLAEKNVAEQLRKLKESAISLNWTDKEKFELPTLIKESGKNSIISLSCDQRKALEAALTYGVMVLTGGPGTGKTTIVKEILTLLENEGLKIILGAPTGRAAKRLSETTGREAMTVHRLLEAGGGLDDEPMFLKDESNPLDADAIIIDETSMMDIELMSSFLKAVPIGCRIILVGDADQLPSVGSGTVLKDIIRSNIIPVIKLTEVFRQTEESLIVLNAHRVNKGILPQIQSSPDFQFRQTQEGLETAKAIVDLCANELKNEGFDILHEVQVLSPMHKQVCGVENLNRMLQAALNPPNEHEKASLVIGGANQVLREGDKVMQIRNNYLKRVFNGDIGLILAIDEGGILVRYLEEDVFYEREEAGELALSYAMSVHKSQGSEYKVVIMPLSLGHNIMLQRNLLYTAVTRAKERVILLGNKEALKRAVANDRTQKRHSLLAERLQGSVLC